MGRWFRDGKSTMKRKKLFVVKQNRLKTVQLVKEQIEKGLFGRLYLITGNVFGQDHNHIAIGSWRGTREFDGGVLMNQASHYVDLLDWLIGPLNQLMQLQPQLKEEVEDTATLQLRWRNGALGIMAVTMLTYPRNLEGSLTILGEHGSVKIGGPALNQIEYWEFSGESVNDRKIKDVNYEIDNVYGNGHSPYYKNMIGALFDTTRLLVTGEKACEALNYL